MSDPLGWIDDRLKSLDQLGLRRQLRVRRSRQSAREIDLDGRRLLNFGSNDYLGLAGEAVCEAAARSVREDGWGAGASPLLGGRSLQHQQLEQQLARFLEVEASLTFPTGYAANVGCLSALVGRGDHVFSDQLNHASIIDGCRLSRATVHIYPHADLDALQQQLRESPAASRKLIVTDSVFSMHGDVAPLAALVELAERYGAMLMVDEAHATGVFGERGRGACEAAGVAPHVHVGTFSKALGSHGGFVAGSQRLIDWLSGAARAYFFSTASPPATAAAAGAALDVVMREPERRERLLTLADQLRDELHRAGWNTGPSSSQIVPVMLGDVARTMQISERLYGQGVYAPGIRPPSVPEGQSLLRLSLSAAHQEDDLQRVCVLLGSCSE